MMIIGILTAIGIGSVVSVGLVRCVERLPHDQKLWSPFLLQCHFCKNPLPWSWLLPFGHIFFFKRKCSACQKPLSKQTLWIELFTVAGTLIVFLWHDEPSQRVIDLVFLYTMIVLSFIDWNTMIIELRVVVLASSTRLVWLVWFESQAVLYYLASMLMAAGAFYFISVFYEVLRRQQGLGDGDAAVLGVIGLWVGWEALSLTILIAAFSGLVIAGTSLVLQKRSLRTTQIPFAPFLCVGGTVVYYAQDWLKGVTLSLSSKGWSFMFW